MLKNKKPEKLITMTDIARMANVNQSTVSRVLSNTPSRIPIGEEVRKHITKIVRDLNYHPNFNAVALRTGLTKTILVIVSDITDPFYSAIISGIEKTLNEKGFCYILYSLFNSGGEPGFKALINQNRLDGLIILGSPSESKITDAHIVEIFNKGISVALVGRYIEHEHIPSVVVDNDKGGRLVAEHLIKLGHRMISIIKGPREWKDCQNRLKGFSEVLAKHRLNFNDYLLESSSRKADAGYELTKDLLRRKNPTAIFALNDVTAFGSVKAINEMGFKVPEDISVVGFDDIENSFCYNPPLTTIRQPRFEMGKIGAGLLLEAINQRRKKNFRPVAKKIILKPALIIRKSTCAARSK